MQVATKKKLLLLVLENENIRCRWIFALSHDVAILVDSEEVKDSGDSHVEQGYVVIVTSDVLEPGLLVNIYGWTTAAGGLLRLTGGKEAFLYHYYLSLPFLLLTTLSGVLNIFFA